MEPSTYRILYLDDYHAGDVHFLQSLGHALARWSIRPAPLLVHGSGEAAERILEAKGIFRERKHGILPIETTEEHQLVEQAARRLNQHIVAIFNEAVVATVGVFGTQRRTLSVRNGELTASGGGWMVRLAEQGIVPVLAAFAREEPSGGMGEVALPDAVAALADLLGKEACEVVFFTKTNLPGVMAEGKSVERVRLTHPKVERSVPDREGLERLLERGLPVLLTNTTRLADAGGPSGTSLVP